MVNILVCCICIADKDAGYCLTCFEFVQYSETFHSETSTAGSFALEVRYAHDPQLHSDWSWVQNGSDLLAFGFFRNVIVWVFWLFICLKALNCWQVSTFTSFSFKCLPLFHAQSVDFRREIDCGLTFLEEYQTIKSGSSVALAEYDATLLSSDRLTKTIRTYCTTVVLPKLTRTRDGRIALLATKLSEVYNYLLQFY